jgi:hypothetical protein
VLRWQVADGFEEVQVDLGGGRGCGREGRGGELNVLVEPAGQDLMGADPPPPPPDVVVGDLPHPGARVVELWPPLQGSAERLSRRPTVIMLGPVGWKDPDRLDRSQERGGTG